MTVKELKERLNAFDDDLKVFVSNDRWINGVVHHDFFEAVLVLIEQDIRVFDDDTMEFHEEDVLYIG